MDGHRSLRRVQNPAYRPAHRLTRPDAVLWLTQLLRPRTDRGISSDVGRKRCSWDYFFFRVPFESIGDYSQVVRRHTGNGLHEQMDGRAVAAFMLALDDARIPTDPRLRFQLIAWFTWATAMLKQMDHTGRR